MNHICRMVVTDLDDTFLRDDKTISSFTLSTFNRLRQKGIKIAYATGRSRKSALRLVPEGFFDAEIAQNGAVAYIGDELIHHRYIKAVDSVRIMKLATEQNIKIVAETDNKVYTNTDISDTFSWIPHFEIVDSSFDDDSVEKIVYLFRDKSEIKPLTDKLPRTVYYEIGRDNFVQIMNNDASKLSGIEALCRYYGFTTGEVVTFGDDTNDISMIKGVGYGVVLENALPVVKEYANEVCESNQNDGIAKWLVKNVLGEV